MKSTTMQSLAPILTTTPATHIDPPPPTLNQCSTQDNYNNTLGTQHPLPTTTPSLPPTHTPQTPTTPAETIPPVHYTHPAITSLTLNTRGMHTTILYLQSLINTQPKPNLIALTETKHRHIKSIRRHTLRNYKLVYNPSHYDKKTKRALAGTILAIDKKHIHQH